MSGAFIADEVIQLRPLAPEDAESHLLGCDPAIVDSLGGGEPPNRSQVLRWLTANAAGWANGEPVVDLGIEDLATGALCGTVGIQRGLDYLELPDGLRGSAGQRLDPVAGNVLMQHSRHRWAFVACR